MKRFVWILGACLLVIVACTIDDEDRCPDGFYWDGDFKSCFEEEVEDAGDCVIPPETGYGRECFQSSECEGREAAFCLTNPLTPGEPGSCTIGDCVAEDCLCDTVCCDCAAVPQITWGVPVCIGQENAGLLGGMGCTCE